MELGNINEQNSEEATETTSRVKESGTKRKRRIRTFSDSDEEMNDKTAGGQDEKSEHENNADKAKSTESADDSEDEPLAASLSRNPKEANKFDGDSSQLGSETGRKRAREDEESASEDDDEDDFALPLVQYKKVRRVLEDDDDDE